MTARDPAEQAVSHKYARLSESASPNVN